MYVFSNMSLVFSEIYNTIIHGDDDVCLTYNDTMYLVSYSFSLDEFYNNDAIHFCDVMKENYSYLFYNRPYFLRHPNIRNYKNIIRNPKYYTLDIAKTIFLDSGEYICYLKTFWLKIFQRKYKKYYIEKIKLIKKRKKLLNLLNRQLTGIW